MDDWNTFSFPFGIHPIFRGKNGEVLLVSGSVHLPPWRSIGFRFRLRKRKVQRHHWRTQSCEYQWCSVGWVLKKILKQTCLQRIGEHIYIYIGLLSLERGLIFPKRTDITGFSREIGKKNHGWHRPPNRALPEKGDQLRLDTHQKTYFNPEILRETQHTPGAYPRHPQTPKWKEFLHKLLVGGLGYAPGVCWKVLREMWWNLDISGAQKSWSFFLDIEYPPWIRYLHDGHLMASLVFRSG